MAMSVQLELKHQQVLSMQQIQSLNILACSNQELAEVMNQEFLENPMLESDGDKTGDLISSLDKVYENSTASQQDDNYGESEENKKYPDIADTRSHNIEDLLLSQLDSRKYTKEHWELFRILIQCLDDEGFLKIEPIHLAEAFPYSENEIQDAVDTLQKLEPVGIFSRNLSECILKQLSQKGIEDPILFQLVSESLPEIASGNLAQMSRKYKLSTEELKKYIHIIGSMNPRPIMNAEKEDSQFIVPDIIVRRENDGYSIQINDNWVGNYRLNDYYLKLLKTTRNSELREYFEKKLLRARNLLAAVEQRRKTIVRIAEFIVKFQRGYFENDEPLKTLKMEDIADQIDINVSTVSRAIKGKYIQYRKTIPLRDLFSSAAVVGNNQNEYSSADMRDRIKSIIEAEDKSKPLSDQKISEILKNDGIPISRRTIAKYRTDAGILDSRQRMFLKE